MISITKILSVIETESAYRRIETILKLNSLLAKL